MSNCIDINSSFGLPLSDEYFNSDKFLSDVKKWSDDDPGFDDPPLQQYCFYWFMGGNAVTVEDDTIWIYLGRHRSTLTFRDLRQCLHVLAGYFHNLPKGTVPQIELKVRDTDNLGPGESHYETFSIKRLS